MPEEQAQAGVNETFDANGRLEVADDVFLSDDELGAPDGGENTNEGQHDEQPAPATENNEQQTPQNTEPNQQTPQTQQTQDQQPKLYAGKFQSEQELKNEFIRLGGNPANYDSPEKLEMAYETRVSEQQRWQREQQERQRIEQLADTPQPLTAEQIAQQAAQGIDFSQAESPQELGQMFTQVLQKAIGLAQENQQPGVDPQQVASQVQEVQQKQEALSHMESKVPRLTTDKGFRRQFALHVANGKQDGTPYARSKEGLEEAMKDFLDSARSIVDEAGKMTQQQQEIKNTATGATAPTGGDAQSTGSNNPSPEDDILGGIMGAYQERQHRHGMF